MVSNYLVERFFAEKFNEQVCRAILQAVDAGTGARYLTFNVFNVALDMDEGRVTVEDELDASSECTVSLASFLGRVREYPASP